MTVIEVTNELKKMSNFDRLQVIETATKLVRDEIEEKQNFSARKKLSLRESAELMREEYLKNKELTILTDSLAAEDFYDV